ncbi:TetR/AcrR family transcriptional regulator [Peterkaempfera bronchialis]|uniref:TetR/AcrR family transcriptional regulator n=1 Tax=Peterkaempfera bronchialis TaxID=2126346 RepID=A0A345T4E9_9ACTN|nr:TetR/AcrR family transcriptional regulator [Peterkaempfera bronchialis]AXI80854.1 TetR/AcrR family transcriptional regulator [Peterkaempfera bronchialis]
MTAPPPSAAPHEPRTGPAPASSRADRPAAGPRGRERVLDATLALLAEAGYGRVTVEGVAAASRVHKSTLYRWWPDKAALVADALASRLDAGPVPDTGTTRGDLAAWLEGTIANYTATPAGAAMPALIADLAGRPGALDAFRAAFLTERRANCATLLHRGIARGDLPADTDVDLFMDALAGAVFYRQLVTGLPIDRDLPHRLLRLLGL